MGKPAQTMQTLIGLNISALMTRRLTAYKRSTNGIMKLLEFLLLLLILFSFIGCAPVNTPVPTPVPPTPTSTPPAPVGAFESGEYRNLFNEYLGKSDAEIQAKIDAAWDQFFYGSDDFERVYYPVGEDMAYIMDIGNGDVRSEGMSYGMMIAVQLDKKEEFDRLWKWAKTYMYQSDGPYQGYFAWHCTPEGRDNWMPIPPRMARNGLPWLCYSLRIAGAMAKASSIIKPRRRRSWM